MVVQSWDGIQIKRALAQGGRVAFAPTHGQAMVMDDLVLLETEITPSCPRCSTAH
jgi:hypothetical protein